MKSKQMSSMLHLNEEILARENFFFILKDITYFICNACSKHTFSEHHNLQERVDT